MDSCKDPIFFNNQDYAALRAEHRNGSRLFFDESFPADLSSLSPTNRLENLELVEWKRPPEISASPRLFVQGSSIHDVCQGRLGDCWLISALAVLAQHPRCLQKVIPNVADQEWDVADPGRYTGMYRFCFWKFGEWIQVVVDDRLPYQDGHLVFARSKTRNEFWSALVEKAYAKINGSYEALIGGLTCESLVDFTGGIPEQIFDIKRYAQNESELLNLFNLLKFDCRDGSMICSSIPSRSGETEERLVNGLITTHAYSITGIYKLDIMACPPLYSKYKTEYLMCVKVRNPWGQREWTGALSDQSDEWVAISSREKKKMNFLKKDDGEFWILLQDFVANFSQITIVRLIRTGVFKYNTNWYGSSGNNYWTEAACDRKSALAEKGGGGQFMISIIKPGGDVVLLHLLQRCLRGYETPLGIIIAQVERNRNFMVHSERVCNIKLEYRLGGSRSICLRYKLECGNYIIKPFLTTQPPKATFPIYFLLRCFTTKKNDGRFLPQEIPQASSNCFCKPKHTAVTSRLQIEQAEMTVSAKELDVTNIFCKVLCEDQVLETCCSSSETELVWNESFLIDRTQLNLPVTVQIVHRGRIFNSVIGVVNYLCDPRTINSTVVQKSETHVYEPNLRDLSTKIKSLKVSWCHSDSKMSL